MRDGALKDRRSHTARPAKLSVARAKVGDAQAFAAARAEWSSLFRKIVPAGGANGDAAEGGKRVAANAAVSGKQDGSETVSGTSDHANHCTPRRVLV